VVMAVQQELPSQNEQPDPERQAQWPAWDSVAEKGSSDGPGGASCDQSQQQFCICASRKPMSPAADERDDEAERDIRTDDLRRDKRGQAQECSAAQGARASGGEAYLGTYWKHQPWQQAAMVASASIMLHRSKRIGNLPACGANQNCTQKRVEQIL